MSGFVENTVLWTLALYGLFEIIKAILYLHTYKKYSKTNLANIIIVAKNKEQNIEGFLRSILFKFFYEKDVFVNKIILTDLNSKDNTKEILKKLSDDYEFINYIEGQDLINMLSKEMH